MSREHALEDSETARKWAGEVINNLACKRSADGGDDDERGRRQKVEKGDGAKEKTEEEADSRHCTHL